ncbi:thioredoxin family protein [Arthrobacter sp. TMN-50]
MNITLQYFEGCPNWTLAYERLIALAKDHPDIVLSRQIIDTAEEAERTGFHGSPSILIDDNDPFAGPGAPVGLACRRYLTPEGPAGAPTLDQLRAALAPAGAALVTTPFSDKKEV